MSTVSPSVTAVQKSPYPYSSKLPSSPQITTRPRPPGSTASAPTFKVPAHKHAHHLHTIPPREKSTRTLILDHLLWVHARTRLQQARAELGMTVNRDVAWEAGENLGGMQPNRDREEQDPVSDGEDIMNIKFGAKGPERTDRSPEEEEHEAMQNLPLAHTLRLRADGVEKVLIAMLDQPPEVQLPYSDEDTPRPPPSIHGVGEYHFPNGVRLRLALSTLVNDLFARDTPTPLSPRPSNTPAFQARNAQTPLSTPNFAPTAGTPKTPNSFSLPPSRIYPKDKKTYDGFLDNGLPIAIAHLAAIANFSLSPEHHSSNGQSLPSISAFTSSNASITTDTLPPIISQGHSTSQAQSQFSRPRRATGRVLSLYEAGADPSTANSPPSFRCPRHLHHTCQICAPAKVMTGISGFVPSFYQSGTSPSPIQSRAAITLGSNGKNRSPGIGGMAAIPASGLVSWKTGAGIGAGLTSPGIEGTVLRRRTISHHTNSHPAARDAGPCSSGGKLADLIPRFIRLSALVAVELGREAKDREDEAGRSADGLKRAGPRSDASSAGKDSEDEVEDDLASAHSTEQGARLSVLKAPSSASPYLLSVSFRPTREWYAIFTGLLTRAVLEGYLSRGWRGPQGMECLLGVGLGLGPDFSKGRVSSQKRSGTTNEEKINADAFDDEFAHLDPDECPSLVDAARILFPTLCKPSLSVVQRRDKVIEGPEAEYEAEMLERVAEFLTVPSSTPDLSTHFEDLAYKFPAEPIERAIVRFCEAVANWRGLPELENYKKKNDQPPSKQSSGTTSSSAQMSIDSLVQSSAGATQSAVTTSRLPKTPVELYFVPPAPPSSKRRRSNTQTSSKQSEYKLKKTHFEIDEWTGPYGI